MILAANRSIFAPKTLLLHNFKDLKCLRYLKTEYGLPFSRPVRIALQIYDKGQDAATTLPARIEEAAVLFKNCRLVLNHR
ncbi:hypothetical protein B7W85_01495 [Allorhizobium ampelinum]|nr:hypothetical protein B7W85_01495 [Allorhizobium ampelinum]